MRGQGAEKGCGAACIQMRSECCRWESKTQRSSRECSVALSSGDLHRTRLVLLCPTTGAHAPSNQPNKLHRNALLALCC